MAIVFMSSLTTLTLAQEVTVSGEWVILGLCGGAMLVLFGCTISDLFSAWAAKRFGLDLSGNNR